MGAGISVDVNQTVVNIHQTTFNDRSAIKFVEQMKNNMTVRALGIVLCKTTPTAFDTVCKMLEENRYITKFAINSLSTGDPGAISLARVLKVNKTLTELNLANNCYTYFGMEALTEALKTNTTVVDFNIWANFFGPLGAKHVGSMMAQNNTITRLNISFCEIGDIGGVAIAEGLRENKSIAYLEANMNKFSTSLGAFGPALKQNNTLKELHLEKATFDVNSMTEFGKGLRDNKSLTTLNLCDSRMGDEVAVILAESLKNNTTLTSLDLYGSTFTQVGGQALLQALQSKNYTLKEIKLEGNIELAVSHEHIIKAINELLERNKKGPPPAKWFPSLSVF